MTATTRLWIFGTVTVTIALLLAGWFVGIQPLLAAAATADSDRATIEAQNDAKVITIAQLAKDNENLPALERSYTTLQKSIPTTPSTPDFITGLDTLAGATGVQVKTITVGAATAYTIPASAVPKPETTSDDPDAAAPSTEPEPVGATAVTSPLVTPENFFGIEVGVDVEGTYADVLAFVKGMQSGSRLFLLTSFTSTTNAEGGGVTARVGGLIYVLKPVD